VKIIEQQFSKQVAMAHTGTQLNTLAVELQTALFHYDLPEALANTGLSIDRDGLRDLLVQAHGVTLKGRFDHVWLADGHESPPLGGRYQFFKQDAEGHDVDLFCELVFDDLGNTRLGRDSFVTDTINGNSDALPETLRRIALFLVTSIHKKLDTIPRKA